MKPISSKIYSDKEVIEHWFKMAHGGEEDPEYWKKHQKEMKHWSENEIGRLSYKHWRLVEMPIEDVEGHYECDEDVVDDYVAYYPKSPKLPAIVVRPKGNKWVTMDGCHRLKTAKRLKLPTIDAFVPAESFKEKATARYTVRECL